MNFEVVGTSVVVPSGHWSAVSMSLLCYLQITEQLENAKLGLTESPVVACPTFVTVTKPAEVRQCSGMLEHQNCCCSLCSVVELDFGFIVVDIVFETECFIPGW